MAITVTTQGELNQALTDGVVDIIVDSPAGVWIYLSGSATVSASGSATVSASGSATVRAYGSATVRAYDSATVSAYDSATVSAYDSATVRAKTHAAVHLHSTRVTTNGGVIIDATTIDYSDPIEWCDSRGVDIDADGIAYLYKAVDTQWTTARGTDYSPGTLPEAPDWDPTPECGGGLHACAHPLDALGYHPGPRFVRFGVVAADIIVINPTWQTRDKVKVPRAVTPCVAVDVHGRLVDAEVVC